MEERENIPQDLRPIQVSTKIIAPIEKVWDAITKPQRMREWYFDVVENEIIDGSVFSFYEPGDEHEFYHECFVLEFEEPTKFRHTWAYPKLSQGSSTVNWDLKKEGDMTEVILTHESIHELEDAGPEITRENFAEGWIEILNENLKTYLEESD
ncbi:SRPBCC domain-containing protein [Flavobacteriaceae bacterium Ap0902]|nr:SRPBCC domain-containing protein [Flavobacteriaceae bacterium Ap0902]